MHELASTAGGSAIGRAQLPSWIVRTPEAKPPPPEPRPEVPSEQEFAAAFQELGGSVHALARRFGRERRQIYRWMDSYGLRPRPPLDDDRKKPR